MFRSNRYLSLFIIIITIFSLSACKQTNGILGSDPEVETELITTTEIAIPIEKIRTLNPVISKDEDSYYLNKLIYEGLFKLDETLSPVTVLADSYEYSSENVAVTINLKKDVLWQDGNKFTADDVKFTFEAYSKVSQNQGSIYSSNISIIKSVDIVDDSTIIIKFKDKNNAAIENLTFPILPKHLFKKPADVQKVVEDFYPVGTGPYMIGSIEKGKQIVLKANPKYRGKVPINTLKFKVMPGKEEAINLFEISEINLSFLKQLDRNTILNYKDVNVISFPSNEVEVLGFNFKHGALSDKRVRQAIASAINNENILETCYYNSGVLNDTIYFPGYMGEEHINTSYYYDTEKAKSLLKESGYQGLTLNMLVDGENKARNLAAQLIKSDLEKIGVSVMLMPLNREDYINAFTKGDFDLYIGGFKIKDTYDIRPIIHSDYNNPIGYSNIRMDSLADRMQSANNQTDKKQAFKQIQDLLRTEVPYLCLLYKTYGIAVPTGFDGIDRPNFTHIYDGCEDWSITYEVVTN